MLRMHTHRRDGFIRSDILSILAEVIFGRFNPLWGRFYMNPFLLFKVQMGLTHTRCGEETTRYWDFIYKEVEPRDLGHTCRECKGAFCNVGETMAVRRGLSISCLR